ncbi:MAG: Uroporphyrinogen-III synthase (EC [uncultured Sulfurovum sp.]|uniref:Uroporphyrinogen-III synthase n=1 Tax=uncultured Sulfurovum sp. TaxID=269237 RepID=A0A6S6TI28_9BACT|nr:MAG: Uroporphyrinogen-III synthase (EC [uncultured Sulfurovum sp.]
MHIKEFINSLDLLYYEYNSEKNSLIKDVNYSNKHTESEFFKLTYDLSKKHIFFDVLKDKTITFSKHQSLLKGYSSMILEKLKNRNKNIFLLNDKKVQWAKNIPLFKIVYSKESIDLEGYDVLIFTSKHAIKGIDALNETWKKIPAYVISEQTGKLLKDLNGNLKYVSTTKHGDAFAHEILSQLKGKKVLYLRGKEVVSDLISILKEHQVECDDKVIYENIFNESVEKINIPKNSKIIFTSPSTIKYFFQVFSWDDSYTAISIGKTTAEYFPKHISPIIADNTSFKSCVDKALSLNKG